MRKLEQIKSNPNFRIKYDLEFTNKKKLYHVKKGQIVYVSAFDENEFLFYKTGVIWIRRENCVTKAMSFIENSGERIFRMDSCIELNPIRSYNTPVLSKTFDLVDISVYDEGIVGRYYDDGVLKDVFCPYKTNAAVMEQ